jgi:hypothetical protein
MTINSQVDANTVFAPNLPPAPPIPKSGLLALYGNALAAFGLSRRDKF